MFARKTNTRRSAPIAIAIIALFALAGATTAVRAQVLYGTLTGTVTDVSGAVIANAHVTALEMQTGVGQIQETDASGIYRFSTLLPGTYKITIAGQGFSQQETQGVVVRGNEIARVDAQLKVPLVSD